VLPKHYWEGKTFENTTLIPPLGSGPYKVDSFRVPAYIVDRAIRTIGLETAGQDGPRQLRRDAHRPTTRIRMWRISPSWPAPSDYTIESSAKVWATGYEPRRRPTGA